jgi:processive 1,2-diacylglycerol beta-glucosyltransferase
VVAGKNAEALAALHELANAYPARLFPHGFTDKVERLMACADLIVTKPGRLTTTECHAMGLPVIVNAPLPGQWGRNADVLLAQRFAVEASDQDGLDDRIRMLRETPAKLANMCAKARGLRRLMCSRMS